MADLKPHESNIKTNHDVYNSKTRQLKNMIHPPQEFIEMKAHEKKLKQEAIKAKKDYYINIIEELKKNINDFKTYVSQ